MCLDILTRHHPHFHREPAIGGGDVMRRAARNHADMQRGEGRIKGRRNRGRLMGLNFGIAVIDPTDQPRALHDGRHTIGQKRGMHLKPLHMHMKPGAALMASDDLHVRRLANQRSGPFGQNLPHRLDHRRRAGAAHLFVIGQCQLHRPPHAHLLRPHQGPDRQGDIALHVTGAAPVKPTIAFDNSPWVGCPVLPIHRHHIGMARQDDRALNPRSSMGHQRGFLPILVPMAMTFDAMTREIALKPIDQRQIAVPADRGKCHQPFQHLTRRQFFHG